MTLEHVEIEGLIAEARETAAKIDRATPGPWFVPRYGKGSYIISRAKEVFENRVNFLRGGLDVLEARDPIRKKDRDAICVARNDSPRLLLEMAAHLERLIQKPMTVREAFNLCIGDVPATATCHAWYRDVPDDETDVPHIKPTVVCPSGVGGGMMIAGCWMSKGLVEDGDIQVGPDISDAPAYLFTSLFGERYRQVVEEGTRA